MKPNRPRIHTERTAPSDAARAPNGVWHRVRSVAAIAHFIRAGERFNDRMGNQFGAAITYFSFLSLIPILMVSFACAGFVLASNPDLLTGLINRIVNSISDPSLAHTLKDTVNTAVRQRTTVGVTGLLMALYSGVNWIGNARGNFGAVARRMGAAAS